MHHLAPKCSASGLSTHAEARAQQRGIQLGVIDLVVTEADMSIHAGEGLKTIRISRGKLKSLRDNGLPTRLIERAHNVVLVTDPLTATIVTVLRDYGVNGKRYRRQMETRSRRSKNRRRQSGGMLQFVVPTSTIH